MRLLGLLLLVSIGLAACAGASAPSASLPLAEGRPTFLFFYTDN